MSDRPTATPMVGVAEFDCTPAGGPLWGRLRGVVLAAETTDGLRVICAADGVRIGVDTLAELAKLVGLSEASLAVWTGGVPVVDLPMEAVKDAVLQALSQRVPGTLRVARGVAWRGRCADEASPLLAGQRLKRSHRQLQGRAPDGPLAELTLALNGEPPPPGGAWGELLADQRVAVVGAWDAADTPLAIIGWVSGEDHFARSGWPTAGTRGETARVLTETLSGAETHVPVVVVGPSTPGLLGPIARLPSDPSDARRRGEQTADTLARALARVSERAAPVASVQMGGVVADLSGAAVRDGQTSLSTSPASPAESKVAVGLTHLGDLSFATVPGWVTDGLRLRLEALEGLAHVFVVGQAGGDAGWFATPREVHHLTRPAPWGEAQGLWLLERTADLLESATSSATDSLVFAPPATAAEPQLEVAEAPHLQVTMKRQKGKGRAPRTLELAARWRVEGPVSVPGNRWQVCLEWEKDGQFEPVMLRGQPVDDRRRGMYLRTYSDSTGDRVQLGWVVAEPRRWVGRTFRLQVGPAYGGPFVSRPFTRK